jgi:hypothetical protein
MEMRLDTMSRYFDVMNLQCEFVNIDKTIEVEVGRQRDANPTHGPLYHSS